MSRGVDARIADVRRLVAAAAAVYADRARIASEIARFTGLTLEGVELGFESLERSAGDDELRALVALAGTAGRVHTILSANVFVAPLRAIILARAAADRVTVRPSPRDPVLARAIVEAAGDDAIAIVDERDTAPGAADEVHVYGRDETIAAVRARVPTGTRVRGHGAGLGVAMVTRASDVIAAADLLAADVVPFDQRGCLSPRIAMVEGDETRAVAFGDALHECLHAWELRVPRGRVLGQERVDSTRWIETMAFAGRVWKGDNHAIALVPMGAPLTMPPAGRHVLVMQAVTVADAAAQLAKIARFVVAVGTDQPERIAAIFPAHVRVSKLGRMQRPTLDGPVDRRSHRRRRNSAGARLSGMR